MKIISPHLTIYRIEYNMINSMLHRITGIFLFIILVLFINIYALAQYSLSFTIMWLNDSILLTLYNILRILIVFSISYHLLHGTTHLIWDTVRNFSKKSIKKIAILEISIAILITLIDIMY